MKTRQDVFNDWLEQVRGRGQLSGQVLLTMLADWAYGRFFLDSSDADSLLREAEQAGKIRRVKGAKPEPTLSERFAGVGGMQYSDKHANYYGHLFCWELA